MSTTTSESAAESGSGHGARAHVLILSWNGWDVLKPCLDSLRGQTYVRRTVLVVDNGSSDGTCSKIRSDYPEVTLVDNGRNLGFCEGNNVGMQRALAAGADYVVLLNQDTEVSPTWLAELMTVAESDPRIGAVGSRMYLHSHRSLLNSTGIELNLAGKAWDRGFGRVDGRSHDEPSEVLGVTGGAMFLRAAALKQVGLLDPAYFAYYEDLDLSVRLWEAGYRIVYAPAAKLSHRFSVSLGDDSPAKNLLMLSNRWRFLLKHFPAASLRSQLKAVGAEEARILVAMLRRRAFALARLRLRSYWRTLRNGRSILAYRRGRRLEPRRERPWLRFVIPRYDDPTTFVPRRDYVQQESPQDATTNRILMGVNDTALGEGWYPLARAKEGDPRLLTAPAYRGFGRTAVCFLRSGEPGPQVLQLHVSHPLAALDPPKLQVWCNGHRVGDTLVETYAGEWWTIQFPLDHVTESAEIRLVVCNPMLRERSLLDADLGLRVNEVSVLGHRSPFLRTNLGQQEAPGRSFAATTLAPSQLRATLGVKGRPNWTPHAVELTLEIRNDGDTLWLTPETAGASGFVTVGAHMLDAGGETVCELGPRALLRRPVFPGERTEVPLRLNIPAGTAGAFLKIDLVDENVVWFEHAGSQPLRVPVSE